MNDSIKTIINGLMTRVQSMIDGLKSYTDRNLTELKSYISKTPIDGKNLPEGVPYKCTIDGTTERHPLPADLMPVQNAAVGQTVIVKKVDENGVPTDWEAVDMEPPELSDYMTLNTDQAVSSGFRDYKKIQGGFHIRRKGQTNMNPSCYIGYDNSYTNSFFIRHNESYDPIVIRSDVNGKGYIRVGDYNKQKQKIIIENDSITFESNDLGAMLIPTEEGILFRSVNGSMPARITGIIIPKKDTDAANKAYVDGKISDTAVIINSSTEGSEKKFQITVNDSGTLSATEITS